MENYIVNISPKRYARAKTKEPIVRHNNDLVVEFLFASGSGFTDGLKTAVFVTDRGVQKRPFTGNTCVIPLMDDSDGGIVKIGVVEGDIHTTSKAMIPIIDAITSGDGADVDPIDPDLPIASSLTLNDCIEVLIVVDGETKIATLGTLASLIGSGGGGGVDTYWTLQDGILSPLGGVVAVSLEDASLMNVEELTFSDGRHPVKVGVRIQPPTENTPGSTGDYVYCTSNSRLYLCNGVSDGNYIWNRIAYYSEIAGKYTKPENGIPASDLAADVQTSLGKADTALQEHQSLAAYRTASDQDVIDGAQNDAIAARYVKPSGGIPKSDFASGVQTSLGLADTALQSGDLAAYRTAAAQDFIDNAQDLLINEKYSMPRGGIPKTDLASAVQASLNKADTALQTHQDISDKQDKSNLVTTLSAQSTDVQYPSAKCVYDLVGNIESLLSEI